MQGEIIPVNGGAMGDGLFFRQVAIEFVDVIDVDSYNFWQLQFIMPYALVHILYVIFGLELEPDTLISGMRIIHLVFVGLTVYWYFQLSKKLRLTDELEALGLILLVVNFAVLKDYWYNPFLPGLGALMLGMAQANYFIRHEKSKLFLISLLGTFTWPTLVVTGALLLVLPAGKLSLHEQGRPKSAVPVLLTAFVCFLLVLIALQMGRFEQGLFASLLTFSAILSIGAVVFAMLYWNPVNGKQSWKYIKGRLDAKRIAVFVGIIVLIGILLGLLSGSNDNVRLTDLWLSFWSDKLVRPFDFLTGHLMYWGLLLPLTVVLGPKMLIQASRLGMGFVLVLLLMLPFIFHPESRLLVPFIPFVLLLVVKSLRRYALLSKDVWALGVIALVLSMFWVSLDIQDMGEALYANDWTTFPAQRYGMHYGHLQNFPVYLSALVVFVGLYTIGKMGLRRYGRQ